MPKPKLYASNTLKSATQTQAARDESDVIGFEDAPVVS
jgi:hypothetical protein